MSPTSTLNASKPKSALKVICSRPRNKVSLARRCAADALVVKGSGKSNEDSSPLSWPKKALALPVPEPTPVAVKVTPTVLEDAPIAAKLVLPASVIVYTSPTTKLPASVELENLG